MLKFPLHKRLCIVSSCIYRILGGVGVCFLFKGVLRTHGNIKLQDNILRTWILSSTNFWTSILYRTCYYLEFCSTKKSGEIKQSTTSKKHFVLWGASPLMFTQPTWIVTHNGKSLYNWFDVHWKFLLPIDWIEVDKMKLKTTIITKMLNSSSILLKCLLIFWQID